MPPLRRQFWKAWTSIDPPLMVPVMAEPVACGVRQPNRLKKPLDIDRMSAHLSFKPSLFNSLDASANTVPTPNLPPKCMNVLAGGINALQSKALGLIRNYYFREEIAGGRARGANRAASRGP